MGNKLSQEDLAMLKSTEESTGIRTAALVVSVARSPRVTLHFNASALSPFFLPGPFASKRLPQLAKILTVPSSMDRKELLKEFKKFKKQFSDVGINRDQFRQMAQTFLPEQQRTTSFIDRLFNAFDSDRSGTVDFQEFMLAMTLCSSENPEDKLRFCFKSLDLDNNGWLDREEVLYAVELIFKHNPGLENKVAADVNTPQKVVQKIFEYVDSDKDNKLTAEELINFMHKDSKTFAYLGLNLIFLT